MATIEERTGKDGKKTYRVKIRLKGHPTITETFHRQTDAKRWIQKTESDIREGRYFKTNESRRRTMGELIDKYLENRLNHRGNDKETVKPQLLWWKEKIGAYLLANVTPQMIAGHRDDLINTPQLKTGEKQPRKLKSATVIRYLATLSVCFTYGIEDLGWIEQNPVKQVKKPKPERGRVRFLSELEQKALLQACQQSTYPHLTTIVLMALTTGARQSEILNLTWKYVDFRGEKATFTDTKNGETRSAHLTDIVLKRLNIMKKVQRIDTQYLFPNPQGQKPMYIRRHWEKALKTADKILEGQGQKATLSDFRFHDLRHTAASYLAMEGASLLEIAETLGHKTMSMVKRYSHLTEGHTRKVVDNMVEQRFSHSLLL